MTDIAEAVRRYGVPRTATLADAILSSGALPRVAFGLTGTRSEVRVAGAARGVVHLGSVDVILEAIDQLEAGEVLVIDDGGRRDRACVGDLIALEAKNAGAAAMVVWGMHRDSDQLPDIALPVFSLGCCPVGPMPNDPFDESRRHTQEARIGVASIAVGDVVVADDDGVLILDEVTFTTTIAEAARIESMESEQVTRMRGGQSFREQVRFSDYLEQRSRDRDYTFREHLARLAKTIER